MIVKLRRENGAYIIKTEIGETKVYRLKYALSLAERYRNAHV